MNNVIISGYFNPLHKGHLEYIAQAKRLGIVFAIVNSDYQVQLKGSIPFLDQETRLVVIKPHVYDAIISNFDTDKSVANTIRNLYNRDKSADWILLNSGDVGTAQVNQTRLHPKEQAVCDELGIKIMYGAESKIESSSSLIEKAAREWFKRRLGLQYA